RRELLDLGRRLFFDANRDDIHPGLARRFESQYRKAAVARDHAETLAHLMNPRSDVRMNSSSSSSSGVIDTSSRIRSTACVVFSCDRVIRRNALCNASIVSAANPRRSNPLAFAAYTFTSRGLTVVENGSTSCVITLYPPIMQCRP